MTDDQIRHSSLDTRHLYTLEYGDGPALIILHGLLGASGNWHTLSRSVFAKHFKVFALDLRNHGRSPHHDVFDYPSMVGDVIEFMDHRRLDEAFVLGHSMGGKAAMWMALQHPDRISRLIVADMAPKAYPPHHLQLLEALRALDLKQYTSRADIDNALAEEIEDTRIRQFLLKNLTSNGAGSYSWKMNLPAIYSNYERINQELTHTNSFTKPTLFIRGGRSAYILDEDIPLIQRLFPDAAVATLPEAGHWVHADAPKPFGELVVEFLV